MLVEALRGVDIAGDERGGGQIARPECRIFVVADVARDLQGLLEVWARALDVVLEEISAAQFSEGLFLVGRHTAPLMHVNGLLLHGDGLIESAEPRVADARIVHGTRVDEHLIEILERQHALEPLKRFVAAVANEHAHAEVVQRQHFAIAIAGGHSLGHGFGQPRLGFGPFPEPHPDLAAQHFDVQPKFTILGGEPARFIECRQGVGQASLHHLRSRHEIDLAGTQRRERRSVGQWLADDRQRLREIGLCEEHLGPKEIEPPGSLRLGLGGGEREAAIDEGECLGHFAPPQGETGRLERFIDLALGRRPAGRDRHERQNGSKTFHSNTRTT